MKTAAALDPADLWSFGPDGERAGLLNAEVHRRLVRSLDYVFGEIADALGVDQSALGEWLRRLEGAERVDPLLHTLFHTLVAQIGAEDSEGAAATLERMLTLGVAQPGPSIHSVDNAVQAARPINLFSRFADLEEDNRLDLRAPTPAQAARGRSLLTEALAQIQRNDPQLDAELRALVTEFLLVDQAPGHLFTTAAVSCFQNWGGLLFNPSVHDDALNVVEILAHEATHLILFAVAMDEPLLTNPPDARYHSPLREAPRTMDGVFHATIVSARVVRAMLRQAEGAGDGAEYRRMALIRCERNLKLFAEGVAIVEANGMLTRLGRRVLDDSKAFIAEKRGELLAVA
jgi:HEXXH motif-containing protein